VLMVPNGLLGTQGSSVSVVIGLRVRFSAGVGIFSFRHRIQTGSGAHPVGSGGSLPGGKATGA
jgi:hypothetical protein